MDGAPERGVQVFEKIEYARRQAVESYARATECLDIRVRDEWLKAAHIWEQLIEQYELLRRISGTAQE